MDFKILNCGIVKSRAKILMHPEPYAGSNMFHPYRFLYLDRQTDRQTERYIDR